MLTEQIDSQKSLQSDCSLTAIIDELEVWQIMTVTTKLTVRRYFIIAASRLCNAVSMRSEQARPKLHKLHRWISQSY